MGLDRYFSLRCNSAGLSRHFFDSVVVCFSVVLTVFVPNESIFICRICFTITVITSLLTTFGFLVALSLVLRCVLTTGGQTVSVEQWLPPWLV